MLSLVCHAACVARFRFNVKGCKAIVLQPFFFVCVRNLVNLHQKFHAMGKGRNSELVSLRDEALCRRYYELTEKQRLRFDDALKVLSKHEFFISEERIMAIIRKKVGELKDIALKPVPKVRMPRITARQLELFAEYEEQKSAENVSVPSGQ